MSEIDDYVTSPELAKRIGRTARWVNLLIEKGRIQAIQPGGKRGHYLIPKSELERILRPITPPRPQ